MISANSKDPLVHVENFALQILQARGDVSGFPRDEVSLSVRALQLSGRNSGMRRRR